MRWLIPISFIALVLLVMGVAWLQAIPREMTLVNRGVATLFILLVIAWFTAELIKGGGDPNRR